MKNNSIEKDHRRENVTHETTTLSVCEKQYNEGNHSSSNLKYSAEEVTSTTSGTPEIAAGSSSVEKEVDSNTDSSTTTPISGER